MIITLKSFVNRMSEATTQSAAEGPLGRKSIKAEPWKYSKVGMWGVLLCSGAVGIAGLAICIVSAARDRAGSTYVGLLVFLVGMYLMISAVKEKSNLDLIDEHFDNLSIETKDELLRTLVKGNAGSSRDILNLIEKLINLVSKKGNK